MASSYHTEIVPLTGDHPLSKLNEYLADEEDKEYELNSLTELTRQAVQGKTDTTERLLVVTKKKSKDA